MCRNIKALFNFDPPATNQEICDASLQFVRKISGFSKPSRANEAAFLSAVDGITAIAAGLLRALQTNTAPKDRDKEASKRKARSAARYAARGAGGAGSQFPVLSSQSSVTRSKRARSVGIRAEN
jgi:hypothetical protein